MNAQPQALKQAHIKPGTKLYIGGHGTSHFAHGHDLHLQETHVDRLVKDGLLLEKPADDAGTDSPAAADASTQAEAAVEPAEPVAETPAAAESDQAEHAGA